MRGEEGSHSPIQSQTPPAGFRRRSRDRAGGRPECLQTARRRAPRTRLRSTGGYTTHTVPTPPPKQRRFRNHRPTYPPRHSRNAFAHTGRFIRICVTVMVHKYGRANSARPDRFLGGELAIVSRECCLRVGAGWRAEQTAEIHNTHCPPPPDGGPQPTLFLSIRGEINEKTVLKISYLQSCTRYITTPDDRRPLLIRPRWPFDNPGFLTVLPNPHEDHSNFPVSLGHEFPDL